MENLKYPIGRFSFLEEVNEDLMRSWLNQLEEQPSIVRDAIAGLTDEQINLPYREGGWTIRQVIHHIADAIINAYVRFKLTLTEEKPQIKLWDEIKWAELEDGKNTSVEFSLAIIDAINARWIILLKSMKKEDFKKELIHPELGNITLEKMLQLYAWHGNHHAAQITTFRNRVDY